MDDVQFQDNAHSYVHAMSSPTDPAPQAIYKANHWVRRELTQARVYEAQGNRRQALVHLGNAMHTLQDATSPVHRGFQYWDDKWSLSLQWVNHEQYELFDPGPGSALYKETLRAYVFWKSRKPLPHTFFPPLSLTVPRAPFPSFNFPANNVPSISITY
jgi:hypothetical protein